jgi:hypothetical protein
MANSFRKGQKISWKWGPHEAQGVVVERFERRVQRTIEGARIVRRGTPDNPAYLVRTDDGKVALKRGTELTAR